MPDMTPVATQIKPPDPNQGISTYSGILGLQQQKQNLQTGQYTQQSAQANASQDQQKNQELQAAQQLAINGAKSGQYDDGQGGVDRQKLANDLLKVAPTYGQPMISALLSQANEVVKNKQAHQDLSQSQQQQMGSTFGALATKGDLSNSDFVDALNTLTDQNKDPQFKRMAMSMLTHLPPNATPQQLQGIAKRWSIAATGPESATGQAVGSPTTVDNGTSIQPGVQASAAAGGGFTPAGAPINKQSVVTTPAGPLAVATPAKGTVAPLTTAGPAGTPNVNATTAEVETGRGLASGVTQRVTQAQAAANNTTQAQDALTRTREILDKPDAIGTGAGFAWKKAVRNVLASANIDTGGADDANTLVKNLARYEAARATQAGLGGTDAARELAHNGSPNASLSTEALKGVITQSLATEKALAAYAGVQGKTKDPDKLSRNEADFRNIPNLVQGYEYGLARNPKEAEEFLKKHGLTRADMAKTRSAIKEFESRGQ